MGFVVDKVGMGHVFSETLCLPVSVIPPVIHNQFTYPRRYITLAIHTVLKQHNYKFYPPHYIVYVRQGLYSLQTERLERIKPPSPHADYTLHTTLPPNPYQGLILLD